MTDDKTKDPVDLRNTPAANTTGKPIAPDTTAKPIADANAPAKDKEKAKILAPGALRDLRDN